MDLRTRFERIIIFFVAEQSVSSAHCTKPFTLYASKRLTNRHAVTTRTWICNGPYFMLWLKRIQHRPLDQTYWCGAFVLSNEPEIEASSAGVSRGAAMFKPRRFTDLHDGQLKLQ